MDPYDDPEIFGDVMNDNPDREFPPRLGFAQFGDRVMGKIKAITSVRFGSDKVFKYVLTDVSAVQQGQSARLAQADLLISQKVLRRELREMKPRPREGEIIDIEYTSDGEKKGGLNPPKLFRVEIVGDRPEPFSNPAPTPMEALDERRQQWEPRNEQIGTVDPDADIFAR